MSTGLVLGVETSCDETAAAVVEKGCEVRGNIVSSQVGKHSPYCGVVPELAAREHLENIHMVVGEALGTAGVGLDKIAAVAVTNGPGLLPALLVGVNFCKGLALANDLPLIAVNHFLAHIYGAFLDGATSDLYDDASYPMIALVVSGGHTSLVKVESSGVAEIVGSTVDDAAGEAFDKGAKLLGLGYPGGPLIDKGAHGGDPRSFAFPRGLTGAAGKPLAPENRFNFSFSGVKTSLLYHSRRNGLILEDGDMTRNIRISEEASPELLRDTLASYQQAIVEVLCSKMLDAAEFFGAKSLVVCGGVACNSRLREEMSRRVPENIALKIAPPKYCTDNAAMIAGIAWHYLKNGISHGIDTDAFSRMSSPILTAPWK
ncbi:MAG: tRNA (adenosine(37)-N6)-threonylcarbamoyltransferase complex transferase subunit TsaD [Victivallales bacterium]|nr:tRNA (adenosine(37)-N6)-threonylcarbamoyltransferase complex transferase subunit TsaD [Victivallales bacterium]